MSTVSDGFITSLVRETGRIRIGADCTREWRECRAEFGPAARGLFRQDGLDADVMATALGFDDDSELREALLAELRARKRRGPKSRLTEDEQYAAHVAAQEESLKAERTVRLTSNGDAGWTVDDLEVSAGGLPGPAAGEGSGARDFGYHPAPPSITGRVARAATREGERPWTISES